MAHTSAAFARPAADWDYIVGAYPPFNASHEHTVQLNVGATPERLTFGFWDCGCGDNSGTFTVTLQPVAGP